MVLYKLVKDRGRKTYLLQEDDVILGGGKGDSDGVDSLAAVGARAQSEDTPTRSPGIKSRSPRKETYLRVCLHE